MCNALHMATNLAIDDRLLDEALRVGGHKTKVHAKGCIECMFAENAELVGSAIKEMLGSAASRGVIAVIAATDEAVRLELIRCNVDRVAPVRGDLGDAEVILNRMISI